LWFVAARTPVSGDCFAGAQSKKAGRSRVGQHVDAVELDAHVGTHLDYLD
jgi:hypothetical protein